ncbi:MAG: hypothetical protein HC916_18230 [Coleofasciculaceae cyanobacterium SM2_1_6]|nr:hypothetical protein [Coleofasciculaceae cyanobacterium SM2_1_6]
MTIKIALAGHTNIGKTTLIRTLIRSNVGEVGDIANLTKKGNSYYFPGLQAEFIDTPGFQNAATVIHYLNGHINKEQLSTEDKEALELDLAVIDSIKESDVVIYLANLGVVPDASHRNEIEAVKRIQPRIVGVLNQYKQTLKGLGSEIASGRCSQWTGLLKQKGVTSIKVFDAYWDKRSKEQEIYDDIYKVLDDNQKSDFLDGLTKFKERQKEIRDEVCIDLADRVQNLQRIEERVRKGQYDGTKKEEIDRKIENQIIREVDKFILFVSKLYEVAAKFTTNSGQDLKVKAKNEINYQDRLATTANLTTVLGGFFAIIGAILGGTVVGILSGGIGTIPGVIEGAKIFGAVGATLGTFGIFLSDGDQTRITMTSPQIENIVKDSLAFVWGLEHKGFGRDRDLTEDEIKDMKNLVDELRTESSNYDWTNIDRRKVIDYCKNILEKLKDY